MIKFISYKKAKTVVPIKFVIKGFLCEVPENFITDGMSNAYGLGAIFGFHKWGISLRQSIIHDYLYVSEGKIYSCIGSPITLTRREADNWFIVSIKDDYSKAQLFLAKVFLYYFGWLKRRF